ncbi:glycosyltransferase [Streptomonospora nanhaiensis]|uniref:Glycosyltransferase involved in cell wall biosynthesis n=1 Tax=Streptomonospora nanhaiensis TaxID=1323731 RepID=A0A853BH83_9ACTN|nr:glycosyltransferase [Streptomonospora nanhaiensis]MBV2367225.1 glycosyltransferase [Streptomonospora nanhaiensis]MBX9388991.1 glycosyltransferase [Streptomonospora nanhaiensis]NYI94095.1 glycosyltransferase involved in cell wall biosynthesis [Streptomonospora nanhaiensis]
MRIAMVSEHASPLALLGEEDTGGQNVHVAELARALGARGHEVTVHTRRSDPGAPATADFAPGVRVHHVDAGPPEPVGKDDLPRYMPEFARHLADEWDRDRPDIVHAHYWMSGRAALDAAAATGVPVVQTFHALGAEKRRHQGPEDTSPAEREDTEFDIAHQAALVIATSSEERRELRTWNVPGERIAVVPCAVDPERFRPEGPAAPRGERPRILCLGRLVPRKGMCTVIGALAAVPEAELVIAGGAPPERMDTDPQIGRLREAAEAAGVAERVRFTGGVARQDVPALLRSADLAVNVPWYEPFGMSTVEAMACGVAVIASHVGGHLDTVVQGVTGRLVPPREPRALAFWLRTLLADPVTRESLGIAAADRAAVRYTWPLVACQTEECYERVLRERGHEVPALAGAPNATDTPTGGI